MQRHDKRNKPRNNRGLIEPQARSGKRNWRQVKQGSRTLVDPRLF
jgi:hypothetical protein